MLLGYDKEGEIKFIFTDGKYLDLKYPNNTAKISNFWGGNHQLTEFFISTKDFPEYSNRKNYKIIKNKLVKKRERKGIEDNTTVITNKNVAVINNSVGIIDTGKIEIPKES